MSTSLHPWILIGHIVGFTIWISGLVATAGLLRAHHGADAASRPGIVTAARRAGALMELGAALAIGLGFYLAFASPRFATNAFASGGWLHVKLLLVVLGVIAPHGYLRVKLKRFRRGESGPIPTFLVPVILLAALAAITLGAHPTLLHK